MSTVLITGATGFLGGAFAAHLLEAHPDVALILPVRADSLARARIRVEASMRRFATVPTARVEVARLDLKQPSAHAALPLERVTHVAHFAVATGADHHALNVDATVGLAEAARHRGRLERFVYVGSGWSCGAGREGLVREDDLPAADPLFAYLTDKCVAEQRLMEVSSLPLQIVRPSLVMGHTTLGCEPSASLFWVLRLIDLIGCAPWKLEQRLDVVPVDWLASVIAHLLFSDAGHKPLRVHLSAGSSSSSWRNIEDAFAMTRSVSRRWTPEAIPTSSWFDLATKALGDGKDEVLERCTRFLAGNAWFDNERLQGCGVPPPPPLHALLHACIARNGNRSIDQQASDDA